MRWTMMGGAALLALGGCGAGDEGAGAPGANAGNAAGAPQGSLASPDGRSEVRGDADFSGLPEGMPAYPRVSGGALQFGGVSDGAEMRVMGFQTADPPAAVIAFYADAGTRAGFREGQRAQSGASMVLGLERADGIMNVTATAGPGGTRVQIMVGSR